MNKGQTDMPHKSELQTLTKLSMRYQVCPSETCHTIISESIITMLMSRDRSDCRVTYDILYHLFGLAYDIRSVYIPIQNRI